MSSDLSSLESPRYLIVAYPELKTFDFNWIQSIRRKHDELRFRAIAPHFTLYFPGSVVSADNSFRELLSDTGTAIFPKSLKMSHI
jgi:hypothetical protein